MENGRRVHFKKLRHQQKEHIKMCYLRAHTTQRAAISPEPAFSMHFSPEKKE